MTRDRKASSSEIRKINRNLIFHYLYDHETVTKQDLALALGISMPTITQNLAELMEKGLLDNSETLESTGGRKARVISIKANARYAVGLDVTANHIGVIIVNLAGEIVYQKRVKAPFYAEKTYFFSMASFIEKALDEADIARERVLGVGIAVPAIVSTDGQSLSYASVLNFTNGKLQDFAEYIPYPCRFFNDATMGCFAEYWNNTSLRGSEADKSIVYLSLSNSVGGAFIMNGDIYEGLNLRSSEFGHMTIVPDGRKCYCGQYGCADAYLAANLLSDSSGGVLGDFFKNLESGEPKTCAIWDEYTYYMALVINNLRMAYDCDVIIGGYVGGYIAPYIHTLRNAIAKRNHFEPDGSYLRACAYKHEATGAGAALMFINSLIRSI